MTTKTIQIPEDVVKDIQEKNADVTVCMQTLNDLVNAHYTDEDTTFFDSPVIAKLRDKASEAQIAFDNAKNALVEKYIPDEDRESAREWDLSYSSGILTYAVKE